MQSTNTIVAVCEAALRCQGQRNCTWECTNYHFHRLHSRWACCSSNSKRDNELPYRWMLFMNDQILSRELLSLASGTINPWHFSALYVRADQISIARLLPLLVPASRMICWPLETASGSKYCHQQGLTPNICRTFSYASIREEIGHLRKITWLGRQAVWRANQRTVDREHEEETYSQHYYFFWIHTLKMVENGYADSATDGAKDYVPVI